jgi:hypothetical protein
MNWSSISEELERWTEANLVHLSMALASMIYDIGTSYQQIIEPRSSL